MDQITTLILENRLQPGDQLPPERELAQKLGVGRNAVREAVKALQERGLLDVIQGAGTFVKHMNSDVISDSLALYIKTNMQYIQLMDLREILDVEIAGRLAANVEKVDLTALWDSLERMQQLIGFGRRVRQRRRPISHRILSRHQERDHLAGHAAGDEPFG